MENLFLSAMDISEKTAIQEIKLNKEFALKLINDLDKVFQTNYDISDEENSVTIRMKVSPSYNWSGCFSFIVTKDGIKFHSRNLGYYKNSPFKNLGELYEKYKDNGTKADSGFLTNSSSQHGFVQFVIPINRNGDNLKDALKDIIYLMEQNQYKKRF